MGGVEEPANSKLMQNGSLNISHAYKASPGGRMRWRHGTRATCLRVIARIRFAPPPRESGEGGRREASVRDESHPR